MPDGGQGARGYHYTDGGSLSRFLGTGHHGSRELAALPADHPAVPGMRSLFQASVKPVSDVPRILVSAINSAKIGKQVRKGPWKGFPIYTLTLEERATCPSSCSLLRECYGNAMPFSRRPRHGPDLIARLEGELRALQASHPRGFVVRVHVLGDFWSLEYLRSWGEWMERFPALHAWGYTAHPASSAMGRAIAAGNGLWPGRWLFRFSATDDPSVPQAHTIWRQPEGAWTPEGLVCPAQTGGTAACATCGLCWSPAMSDTPIVFIGHGMSRRGLGALSDQDPHRKLPRARGERARKPRQRRAPSPPRLFAAPAARSTLRVTLPGLASLGSAERGAAAEQPRRCTVPVRGGGPCGAPACAPYAFCEAHGAAMLGWKTGPPSRPSA